MKRNIALITLIGLGLASAPLYAQEAGKPAEAAKPQMSPIGDQCKQEAIKEKVADADMGAYLKACVEKHAKKTEVSEKSATKSDAREQARNDE